MNRAAKEIACRRERALLTEKRRRREIREQLPDAVPLMDQLARTGHAVALAVSLPGDSTYHLHQVIEQTQAAQKRLEKLLIASGYPADYLDTPYTCKLCEDTGYINGKKCKCFHELSEQYLSAQLSSELPKASFSDFSLQYYPEGEIRKRMEAILKYCQRYADKFSAKSPSLLLMGGTGLGKTHLSVSIGREIISSGRSAKYHSCPELFRCLQQEYYRPRDADILGEALSVKLLILDDLGAEMENQLNISSLYNMINTRMNAHRPTIISTNLAFHELERRYTNRIASRLTTMYKCLRFDGKDIRQLKLIDRGDEN